MSSDTKNLRKKSCIFGCDKLNVHAHRFPHPLNNYEWYSSWVTVLSDKLRDVDPMTVYKNKRVCDYHFKPEEITAGRRVIFGAVPTLNLNGVFQSKYSPQTEHNYTGDSSLSKQSTVRVGQSFEQIELVKEINALDSKHVRTKFDSRPSISQTILNTGLNDTMECSNPWSSSEDIEHDLKKECESDNKMAPILYKIDASPPSNAVRILADIIGLELELKDVDFGTLEHKSAGHVKLNPMGTVPTLVDGDFVISESHATMKYLLAVYGGDKSESLYPSDVRTRALADQAMFFNVGVFFIRLKVIVLPAIFGDLDGPTEKHKADIDEAYGVVEAYLANHKYIVTDHLTIADLSVGATTISMQPLHKLDAARFPRTAAWLARLKAHPSFKKFLIPGAKILGEITNSAWQKNKKKLNK